MATPPVIPPLRPVIQNVIDNVTDRRRMADGIRACEEREADFASTLEMQLAGIAMVSEARQLMSDQLTAYWSDTSRAFRPGDGIIDYSEKEIIIGGGFHAAVYAANRVRMGFPRPVVLEQADAEHIGGAFAVSLNPVFRLNSRNRPGRGGLPDQDKALNFLPGALIQPAMMSSEEYPTNADMAWLVRLTLAQYADVYPGVSVTSIDLSRYSGDQVRLVTSAGTVNPGRVLDARGTGAEKGAAVADGTRILTFNQFMARMGKMFPLRGMQQVAVIGGGDAAKCTVESLLGLAPRHSSAIGLDYVTKVDWYTGGSIDGRTCSEFRDSQRGRYIRIAQALTGNVSNPSTRLQVMGDNRGYPTALPDGVLVNDRTYDMASMCTGSERSSLNVNANLSYYPVRIQGNNAPRRLVQSGPSNQGTILAAQAGPAPSFRIGPAADLPFSVTEVDAGISANSRVAMFRLAPRTAALAMALAAPGQK
jgi:hypothetical protein